MTFWIAKHFYIMFLDFINEFQHFLLLFFFFSIIIYTFNDFLKIY